MKTIKKKKKNTNLFFFFLITLVVSIIKIKILKLQNIPEKNILIKIDYFIFNEYIIVNKL